MPEVWCAYDDARPHLIRWDLGDHHAQATVARMDRDWRPPSSFRANPATAPVPSATSFLTSLAAQSILPSMPAACGAE
jgi:hypothetical protein